MSAVLSASSPSPEATSALQQTEELLAQVIKGKREAIRMCLTALLARGHLLIEDIPGVGKTTLARALAATIGGSFRRIQFTSDLLPADILGTNLYRPHDHSFEFRRGPIFANVVLADEINRTTPRTQSALLEAMSDGQVSVDEETHDLDSPFLVIATQNPSEHFGTYPLPESQMDRFLLRIRLGYPDRDYERKIMRERGATDPVADLTQTFDHTDLQRLQDLTEQVTVTDALVDYAMTLVESTRTDNQFDLGVSTRGAIAFYRAAQARAIVEGRTYCTPDDFKTLAVPALAHRVVLAGDPDTLGGAREEAERAIAAIVEKTEVPV